MAAANSLSVDDFVEAVTRGTLRALDARAAATKGSAKFIDPTWLGIWITEPGRFQLPDLEGLRGPIWIGLVAPLPPDVFKGAVIRK